MKRKYLYLTLLVVSAAFIVSCSKTGLLNKEPLSQLTNSTLGKNTNDTVRFTTAAQAEALLATCYSDFRTEMYQLDLFVNGDMRSDNSYYGAEGNPDYPAIDNFTVNSTNGNIARDWKDLYLMVNHANTVIINVPKISDPSLTASRQKQIVAEAQFIRAWAYFDLVRLYGNIPLVLNEVPAINSNNITQVYPILYPPQVPSPKVYAQIIADLQAALPYVRVTAPNKGYVTKGAIYALLAKVYATMVPLDWNKVSEYSDSVINGRYALVSNYDYLWDGNHKNSSEAILEINYDGNWNAGTGDWGASMFLGADWKKFDTPSHALVNAFLAAGDAVRFKSSINWQDVSGIWTDKHWSSNQYPFSNKIRDYQSGTSDIILLRLAEILLLKAEALNDLGQTAQAAMYINQVRNRVGLPNTTANTQIAMRSAIEDERFLELAFEGKRWFYLVRTDRAVEVMDKVENGLYKGRVSKYKYVYPIPQEQIDLNPNLKQNPGY